MNNLNRKDSFKITLFISHRTLQNWEQSRRYPTGPAAPLIRILNALKMGTAVPQFFTRGSSFELPLVLWVFYRVKIKLLKFFFQTNSLELF